MSDDADPTPTRLPWGLLATVWLTALALRVAAAWRCEGLNPDGVVELTQAQAWAAGDLRGALEPGFSPLLSALTGALHRLLGCPLEATALTVVVLGSSLVAPASACAAAELAPRAKRQAAFAAGLVAAVQPYLVRLGGQVMGYGLAHGLLAVAAALTVRALLRRQVGGAAHAGAWIGLAFLARADAITSGAGLGLALAVGSRRRVPQLAAFTLGALAVAGPYLVTLRAHHGEWRLSGRKTVSELTDAHPTQVGALTADTLRALSAGEAVGDAGAPRTPTPVGGWAGSAVYAGGKVVSSAVLPLFLLALAGAWLAAARPRGPPAHAYALAAFYLGQVMLRANYGYTGRTHASSAAVLVAPLAAVGWALAPWRRLPRPRLAAGAVLALGLVALLPKALAPQQAGRGVQAEVGAWVRAEFGADADTVWGLDSRVVAYRAGARYRDTPSWTPTELAREARAAGVRAFVVSVRHRAPRPASLDAALAAVGAERVDPGFEAQVGKTRYRWLVFRLAH